ncbi:Protein SCAI [Sesbania bispinosa]|nr:Protein SCAI [Sesbania bispinosa]
MSQPQQQQNSNIPVSEQFWILVDKADKKFSKITDLPYYQQQQESDFKEWKVLATICEELPPDGILLVYLSASGSCGTAQNESGCIYFGSHGDRGSNCLYPSDFIPFTRRPLLLVIDNDNSKAFKVIAESEKGESVAMLLSPSCSPPMASNCSRHSNGSLFTMFLSAPLQAFCLLLGLSGTDIDLEIYNKAEMLLSSSLNNWGLALATSETLDPVWGQVLGDPFIRRLLLRTERTSCWHNNSRYRSMRVAIM